MRRGHIYLISFFAVVILAGSVVACRLWSHQQRVGPTLAGVSAIPDLSRWPVDFRKRILALTSAVAEGNQPEQSLGELAVLYLANDYTAEAEKALRVLCLREPENPRWPYLLGTQRLRAGDKVEAKRLFADTLKLAPDYPPALLQSGDLLGGIGRFGEAHACFDRRLKLLPGDSSSLFALAKLDHASGDYEAAAGRLRALVEHDPKFQEAHLMLADLLEKKGDLRGAAEQRGYLRGGRPSPPVADAWLDEVYLLSYDAYRLQAFGAMQLEAGQLENAIPYLQRANQLDPTDADVQNLLAKTYSDLRRWKEAQSILEAGLKYAPENEVLQARLADVLVQQGLTADALTRLQAAVEKLPQKALLHSALGQTFLQMDRAEEAADALRAALKLNPIMVDAQLNLGRALLKLGKRAEAKATIVGAQKMRPDDRGALGMLAALELEDGEFDAAEQHAQSLVTIDPDQPQALDLFARVKLQKGNVVAESGRDNEAEAIYRQGIASHPGFGQLHGALGMLYGKEHRFPEAVAQFQRYLELSPSDPLAHILLGTAYAALGRPDEARTIWARGLDVARDAKSTARIAQLEQLLTPP